LYHTSTITQIIGMTSCSHVWLQVNITHSAHTKHKSLGCTIHRTMKPHTCSNYMVWWSHSCQLFTWENLPIKTL